MHFTTPIPIPKSSNPIDYRSRIVSLGSCFAVNIGQKLDYYKFRNITNPFGILFHPLALEKFIGFAINGKSFTGADIFFHNERWHCYDVHSDLSHPDKDAMLETLNAAIALAKADITAATHLIITLGTAWAYRHAESGNLVANCHKVPQKQFTKELLSAELIKQSLENIISLVKDANPSAQIIFTISPVRHIKDGFTQNQWSKSNLIAALHEVLSTVKSQPTTCYFPSYEIMMDELRDYRFYAQDMIHPNQTAIDFIWERFAGGFTTQAAQNTMQEVEGIQKALSHRPFNPGTEQHKQFLTSVNDRITLLKQQFPHISF